MKNKNAKSPLAAYIRKLHASKALMDDLVFPERVLSRVKLLDPKADTEEILRVMREQNASLSIELEHARTTAPLRRVGQYEKAETRPFYVLDDARVNFDESFVQAQLASLTTQCPVLTIGQVKASDFYCYNWVETEVAGTRALVAFWPISQYPSQLPAETPTGIWSGETGAEFWGYMHVMPRKWWFDPFDMVACAGVLQFTLPPPKCDSTVYWGTKGHVKAVGWTVSGDPAWAETEWVLYESPEGAGFPSDITSYSFYSDGVYKDGGGNFNAYDTETWNRSFKVRAGVQSRIYLGVSIMLYGRNCRIELGGLGSYFNFDYGITYCMTPQTS